MSVSNIITLGNYSWGVLVCPPRPMILAVVPVAMQASSGPNIWQSPQIPRIYGFVACDKAEPVRSASTVPDGDSMFDSVHQYSRRKR